MKDIWSSVYGTFEGKVDQSVIDDCFQKMDKNGDGMVEEEEFVAVIVHFHRDATKKRKAEHTPDRQKRTAGIDVAEFFTSFIKDPVIKGNLMHKMMQNRVNDSYQDTQRFIYRPAYSCKPEFDAEAIWAERGSDVEIHHNCCSTEVTKILNGLGKWNTLLARLAALTDPQERLERHQEFSRLFTVMVQQPAYDPM